MILSFFMPLSNGWGFPGQSQRASHLRSEGVLILLQDFDFAFHDFKNVCPIVKAVFALAVLAEVTCGSALPFIFTAP